MLIFLCDIIHGQDQISTHPNILFFKQYGENLLIAERMVL